MSISSRKGAPSSKVETNVSLPFLKGKDGAVLLLVHLVPRAKSNKVVGEHAGRLKVAIAAPPVDGKANQTLIEFLSKELGLAKSLFSIERGQLSREKDLLVVANYADLLHKITKL